MFKGGPLIKDNLLLFLDPSIKSLGTLEVVKGNVDIDSSAVESLGSLRIVEGRLDMDAALLTEAANLEVVEDSLVIGETKVTCIPKLTKVGQVFMVGSSALMPYLPGIPETTEVIWKKRIPDSVGGDKKIITTYGAVLDRIRLRDATELLPLKNREPNLSILIDLRLKGILK